MARSDKGRPGVSREYASARAADIARYGARRRSADGRLSEGGQTQTTEAPEREPMQADEPHARGTGELRGKAVGPGRAGKPMRGHGKASRRAGRAAGGATPVAGQSSAWRGERALSIIATDQLAVEEARELRRKVILWVFALAVVAVPSLGVFGASTYSAAGQYVMYNPVDVIEALLAHVHNLIGGVTHLFAPEPFGYDVAPFYKPLYEIDGTTAMMSSAESGEGLANAGWDLYGGVLERTSVVGITLVCAVLLSVSGMLYQNVFKNPIAGPGMLGVSSGVSLGMMLLVYLFGIDAFSMLGLRYAVCYGLGAAILAFVILAGRKLSGKGKPFDIVTMLLIGSILSQLVGFVVTYVTLFVMEPEVYQQYITLSQMLVVDTSGISWTVLIAASAISLAPVIYLRFRFNALAFDEQEVRMLGINFTALRAVALICGAIMILAAQIHIGAVAMVSLIVPFLSRSWFGCEFRKQLVGNVCISTVLLLVCRDIVDLIPFVGDGIGIGSAVSVVALPIFLLIMARHMRGWE